MGYKKRTVRSTDEIIEETPESVPESVPENVPESFGTARLARVENTEDADAVTPNNNEMDEATRRKQEIADKRRASLALARSKIVPKSALKKQAEEVIKGKDELLRNKQEETDAMKLKYERERIKQLEDSLTALQKLIVRGNDVPEKPPVPVPVPVPETPKRKQRPSRSKEALAERAIEKSSQSDSPYGTKHDVPSRQPQQIIPKKSVEPRVVARDAPPSTEKLIDKSYGEQLQERLRTQALHKIMSETFGGF